MAILSKFAATLAIVAGVVISFGFAAASFAVPQESCTINGTTISFDGETVKEASARKLGRFLKESGFSNGTEKNVELKRVDQIWQLGFEVGDQFMEDEEYAAVLSVFAKQISLGAFDGQDTEIRISYGGKSKVIEKTALLEGEKVSVNGLNIYFANNVSEKLAKEFGDFLDGTGFCDGTAKDSQLMKGDEGTLIVKFIVGKESREDSKVVDAFQQIAEELSAKIYSDELVVIQLCDYSMKAKKSVDSTGTDRDF